MPRATTKNELIEMAKTHFDKLLGLINTFSLQDQHADFNFNLAEVGKDGANHWSRDKNLKDVLVHLYEWHQLLINWENANINGNNQPFLPSPYTWKNYSEMNNEFTKKHLNTTLEQAKELLNKSHNDVLSIIDKYSDQQLFTKAYFNWTGTSSFGQYCISTTVSHYDWAIKKLKVYAKTSKK